MKATGIVRRIDDLGRVVIPKEIRRTLRIKEGDPLEIFTNHDGEVIFKKYSVMNEISQNASSVADIMFRLAGCPVIIFDTDHVISASGVPKKEYLERRASSRIEELMEDRIIYCCEDENDSFESIDNFNALAIGAAPVISNGDITGAVVFLKNNENKSLSKMQKSLLIAAAQFLGKQTED